MPFSRMSEEKLAQKKGAAKQSGHLARLADAANGFGVTSAARRKAEGELEQAVGRRGAKRLKEESVQAAMRQAGVQPRGLRRWLG